MISQVHRSAASGSRSRGRVQPRVCLNSRKVCSRSNRRRNACQARSTSASSAPVLEDHDHTAGAARSFDGCSTSSRINEPRNPSRVLAVVTRTVFELRASPDQGWTLQPGQLLAQVRIGGDQDRLELIDRLRAGLDSGVLGQFEQTGALHRPVPRLGRERARLLRTARAASCASTGSDLPRRRRAERSGRFTSNTSTRRASK